MAVHDSAYTELLRKSLQHRLMAHGAYLDHFDFVDLKLDGSGTDQHLVLLFRRSAADGCLWGSRSPSLWTTGDDRPSIGFRSIQAPAWTTTWTSSSVAWTCSSGPSTSRTTVPAVRMLPAPVARPE